ncbi:hypothetical protein QFZ70_002608 [Arthrobacter sp. V1I9]|nr:hypothetical protein [Arthrobacter sp. V1I9]
MRKLKKIWFRRRLDASWSSTPGKAGELFAGVGRDGVDDVHLAAAQGDDAAGFLGEEPDFHVVHLRGRAPVVLVAFQAVGAGAAVELGDHVRAGAHAFLQFLRLVLRGGGNQDHAHERVQDGDGLGGHHLEGALVHGNHGGEFGEEAGHEGALHLLVHLQGGGDVLHLHGAVVRVADAVTKGDGPFGGAGHLEALGQDQHGLGFGTDGGEALADGTLDGDGGVKLVELVVQADQRTVEGQGQGAGSRQAGGAGATGEAAGAEQEPGRHTELQQASAGDVTSLRKNGHR